MSSNQAGSIVTSSDLWQAQQEWEDEEIVYMSGYPDDNPKTAYGEAKPKMSDTPTTGIREMGKVFTGGAEKYGRFNWRDHSVSSTVYYDAAQRHLMAWFDGEDIDPESGISHLAHVMACCNILLDAGRCGKLNDNRALTGKGRLTRGD
ncbi:hypothetical protein UFOVP330_30 [uncultured Caudovirales phage]|uniref:dATP/dGTP diphosphohydrolase N-terminal domain-containing protein n=1 Tax=uncultured Caudovirales phage TaxID=2100421 RepID=A0A6J5LYY9_9CAUD|nr:hypothetical protein UFOVP330_30 [uncultured Caudovirales phage]